MDNDELMKIYDESYKKEYESFHRPFQELYEKAIDKKYAIKTQFAIANFLGGLMIGSDLDKEIIKQYEHYMKLGANISEIVKEIPNSIRLYKEERERNIQENKNEVSIEWKKFLGIPYKINKIKASINGKFISPFENLKENEEIAKQLGKQRAILDIQNFLKVKFIEQGEINEFDENNDKNFLPFEFKYLSKLKQSIEKNDLFEFFKILQSLFASFSYDMKITEGYFHSHIHLILKLLDFEIHSEVETNHGRIDSVVESKNYIHIFEFKQNSSDIALEQILNKKYYQKYFLENKKIILVGVAVDKNLRNIVDWSMKTKD